MLLILNLPTNIPQSFETTITRIEQTKNFLDEFFSSSLALRTLSDLITTGLFKLFVLDQHLWKL